MNHLLLLISFGFLWAGVTLLLSCVPGFRTVPQRRSLAERLAPYVTRPQGDWTAAVESWLQRQ